MKTICLLCFTLNFSLIYCQNFKTEAEIKNYLIQNISNLDPIEGIWAIEKFSYKILYSAQLAHEDNDENSIGTMLAVIKNGSKYSVYYKNTNYDISDEYFINKGMQNSYYYYKKINGIPHTINAFLRDLYTLRMDYSMNNQAKAKDEMLAVSSKAIGDKNPAKFEVEFSCVLSKMFPSFSDYKK